MPSISITIMGLHWRYLWHETIQSFLHNGTYFTSERFTRHHEIFCYVKAEHSEEFDGMDLERRGKVKSSLNSVLKTSRLGGVWGNSHTLRLSPALSVLFRTDFMEQKNYDQYIHIHY